MNDGFIRMAAATPRIQVADCGYNRENILEVIEKALKKNSQILALPELCLSGYTCGDLFLQRTLTASVEENLLKIADFLKGKDILVVLGAPLRIQSKLYNTAVFLKDGQILGVVPKTNIPAYSEFSHRANLDPVNIFRHFCRQKRVRFHGIAQSDPFTQLFPDSFRLDSENIQIENIERCSEFAACIFKLFRSHLRFLLSCSCTIK